MTFDRTCPTIANDDMEMEEVRRPCVPSVEEVKSEVRLIEVEASIPLAWRRVSYCVGIKLDDSASYSRDMEERCCAHICEEYDHHQDEKEGYHLDLEEEQRQEPKECDGWMKFTKINLSIKFLAIVLEGQEVSSRGLIDINFLDESLEVTVVGLKREIVLFVGEKKLKDLHNLIDVRSVGIYGLHSKPQETSRDDALLVAQQYLT
ncbi:unnamed protein product [Spirodela intermedia]|uniref:Uncharacterized protein n=1 Tax=Spirodela intermedia TaxID=51605 RepID=A0A7I8K346_SPIIN|nr:unnamed protein product [Spirodela intermedia]